MRIPSAALVVVLGLSTAASGMQPTLDPRAVTEAVTIGQSRGERERARFHAPYRLTVNTAPVDFIEVITPFRRIVLEAESRALTGDRSFGQRQAIALLGSGPLTLDIVVEMTFHPLNTFVGVPDYGVSLVLRGEPPVRPRRIERIPRHGPRLAGAPRPTTQGIPIPTDQPLLGGSMVAQFETQLLNPSGQYDVVVDDAGKELTRVRADLGRMR